MLSKRVILEETGENLMWPLSRVTINKDENGMWEVTKYYQGWSDEDCSIEPLLDKNLYLLINEASYNDRSQDQRDAILEKFKVI